jgi:hydrogenase-4 component F
MIASLILVPGIAGILAMILRRDALCRILLMGASAANGCLFVTTCVRPPQPILTGWLAIDALGRVFLGITAMVFLMGSVYAVGYLDREGKGKRSDFEEGTYFANAPESLFSGCLLLFLAAMNLVCLAHHFGVLWIALEATTLASAPLIYFHRHHRSLEASWKYLIICSVGIAIALLATFFLALAGTGPGGESVPLIVELMTRDAADLHVSWLRAAFIFFLVGYGTKMGLAPLHTWLPDAHSEAPSVVSALMSGALLNCAFLCILRIFQVCEAAGQAPFCQDLLRLMGLLSMGLAAVFILNQRDFKRMLAYSSIAHMGILAFGIASGGVAIFGALLHAVCHSLAKAMMFLLSGNILEVYRTKVTTRIHGLLEAQPGTGTLWIAGFLALSGFPPFGTFMSELLVLKGALDGGRYWEAGIFLLFLALVFVGMTSAVLGMAQGKAQRPEPAVATANLALPITGGLWLGLAPAAILGAFVLLPGIYLPEPFSAALEGAAQLLRAK